MAPNIVNPDIDGILKENWGYDTFRPLQREIVESVLDGHDTIGLLPTGGGKSITFQVPALAIDGLTVVVSPLISLMKDQVDNLRARGIMAVYLHSALTQRETTLAIDRCRLGKAKILYISPEKLSSKSFFDTLRLLPVELIVVDEAHCISQWGYDFRPSYLNICALRKFFPGAPMLALTASATPEVVDDIANKLRMTSPRIFRKSFSRDNLSYIVRYADNKIGKILEVLRGVAGTAIIYVRSRKRTREIAEALVANGIVAEHYHAGLDPREKEERQNRWKSGETRVIVATNAFGMGIDKPDVRVVIHTDLPSSLEEYYQEAGRAGRDGLPAFAVVVASHRDKGLLTRRLADTFPEKEFIRHIYTLVCAYLDIPVGEGYNAVREFNLDQFCHRHSLHQSHVAAALRILTQSGLIDYQEEITSRSRVMMIASKEELYHLDLMATNEAVLRKLLRSYTGLFADYVYISEAMLARELNLTEQQIYESMLALTRLHVLHYIPRKSSPYIFFPTSREEQRNVVIPDTVYKQRRKALAIRLDAMKRFIYDCDKCRVATMLQYFGEHHSSTCGTCDVCRNQRQTKPAIAPSDIELQIKYILSGKDTLSVDQLSIALGKSIEATSRHLRDMADKRQIEIMPGAKVRLCK